MPGFAGRRVLVTGSSRGIGRAAAAAFLAAGARVAVNGRSAASTASGIDALGGDGLVAAPGDVATVAGCDAIVAAAVDGLGGLDILVNSAGICEGGPIEEQGEDVWDATIDVNLKGTYFCIRAALAHLRASRGNVVNVASDAGLLGLPHLAVYCASKGGVVLLTRALSGELAPDVRVNCVCPGYVDTDMVRRDWIEKTRDPARTMAKVEAYAPMRRMAEPAEIAAAILYLASDEAGFTTGTALSVDGGRTACP
ncbi:MAG TPA: SDR family NAD(P)-dependent oxidoreductase [Thermohalobaculum sp.]|nr:SDR family NAD(P)-dependent oxidoreductase [Thermohalobaculum sp.]